MWLLTLLERTWRHPHTNTRTEQPGRQPLQSQEAIPSTRNKLRVSGTAIKKNYWWFYACFPKAADLVCQEWQQAAPTLRLLIRGCCNQLDVGTSMRQKHVFTQRGNLLAAKYREGCLIWISVGLARLVEPGGGVASSCEASVCWLGDALDKAGHVNTG